MRAGGAGSEAGYVITAELSVTGSAPVVCAPGTATWTGSVVEAAHSACVAVAVGAQPLLSGRESSVMGAQATLRSALALPKKVPVTTEFELWPEASGAERRAVGGGRSSGGIALFHPLLASDASSDPQPRARALAHWPLLPYAAVPLLGAGTIDTTT